VAEFTKSLKREVISINNGPDYLVRTAKNINGKERWTDRGVAYTNEKGSITIYLSALPLDDKIILIPTHHEI